MGFIDCLPSQGLRFVGYARGIALPYGSLILKSAIQEAKLGLDIMEPTFKALQQNLWVPTGGSGRSPSVWYKAICNDSMDLNADSGGSRTPILIEAGQ